VKRSFWQKITDFVLGEPKKEEKKVAPKTTPFDKYKGKESKEPKAFERKEQAAKKKK